MNKSFFILANAGSGKTKRLIDHILHLIESGVEASSILCITYTNAGAQEILDRIQNVCGNELPYVSTFHGLCIDILSRFQLELKLPYDFKILSSAEFEKIISRVTKEVITENVEIVNCLAKNIDFKAFESGVKFVVQNRIKIVSQNILDSASEIKSRIYEVFGDDEDPSALASYYFSILTAKIFEKYDAIKNELCLISHDDCILNVRTLFADHKIRDFAMFKMGQKFHHILVDEAQDTNAMQWEIINALAIEPLSGSGSIFVVGDDKQTIYGFQGAQSSILKDIRARYDAYLHDEILQQSYRSTQAILDVVDETFALQYFASFEYQKHISALSSGYGIVESCPIIQMEKGKKADSNLKTFDFSFPDEDDGTSRDTLLAKAIREKINTLIGVRLSNPKYGGRAVSYGDIRILTKQRNPKLVLALKSEFAKFGVDLTLDDKFIFAESLFILDAMAIIHYALYSDQYSLACILRSPIFGFSTEDALKFEYDKTILDPWLSDINTLPVLDFIMKFYVCNRHLYSELESERFEFLISFAEEQNAMTYTQFFDVFEAEKEFDQKKFVHQNAITLMTVHSSKGMEFPVVFILDDEKVTDTSQFIIANRTILRKPESKLRTDNFNAILEAKKHEDDREKLRLLYVAMTRSAEMIYIFQHRSHKWYDAIATAVKKLSNGGAVFSSYPSGYFDIKLPQNTQYKKFTDLQNFEPVQQKPETTYTDNSVNFGILIHLILENIESLSREKILEKAWMLDVPENIIDESIAKCHQLNSFLRNIFPSGKFVRECEFASFGKLFRLDLVIYDGSQIHIIDYKTQKIMIPQVQNQLREYKSALGDIYKNMKIRIYVCWFDDLSLEEVE